MRAATFSSLACAIAISIGSSNALTPMTTSSPSPSTTANTTPNALVMTRRSAALAVIGSAFVVAAPAFAKEELSPEEKEAIAVAKERMRKKIEDSKKSYRKTSDLVKERKDTTDYSCLDKDCSGSTESEGKK
jgi:hypothetical protein